jgi:hypothetical protein
VALHELYWDVPHQRCVFHKYRSVWQAVVPPDTQSPQTARADRRRLIRQAARIWQAPTRAEAGRRRYQDFWRAWQATQPAAVLTLQHDFGDTLTLKLLRLPTNGAHARP